MASNIDCTVSAPGKVILFGEHSVVYKKSAVSTSISRRLFVTLKSLKSEQVLLKFPQISSEVIFDLKQLNGVVQEKCPLQDSDTVLKIHKPDVIDHTAYIESLKGNLEYLGVKLDKLPEKTIAALLGFLFVFRGMCHTVQCDLVPFSLEVNSELEVGAGTGSSASYAVAITASVFNYLKCLIKSDFTTSSPQCSDNVIITSCNYNSGFSLYELRIINKWAHCLEKITHGRPSGIDNTTCTFGSVVVTSQENSTNGGLTFRFLEHIPKITILLISTGVSRNTGQLVAKVRKLREENSAAVDAIFNAMDVIAKEAFKTLDGLGVYCSDSSKGTELHKTLGDLIELNHGLLRTLGVSHESLEHIVKTSGNHGLSSKLTGAGGGGYAITLLPPNYSRENIEALKKELGPQFNVLEVSIAEQGVRIEK